MASASARSPLLLLAALPLGACLGARAPAPPAPPAAAPALEGSARARYHFLVARAEQERGNFAAAARALDAAALYEPRSPWLALARVELARARGDDGAAVFEAEAAVALAPSGAEAHEALGLARFASGNREGAEEALRVAVQLGRAPAAWPVLCTLAVERGADDAAALVAGWSGQPVDDIDERAMRAGLRLRTGDAAGAVDDWTAVSLARPADLSALDSLVRAAAVSRRYRAALLALEHAVQRMPDEAAIARRYAGLAEEAADAARAIAAWSKVDALRRGEDGSHARAHLAMAAISAGRYEVALAASARVRGRAYGEWLAVLRARARAGQGNWREVRRELKGARSLDALQLLAQADAALGGERAAPPTSPMEEARDRIAQPVRLPGDPWALPRAPDPRRGPALDAARRGVAAEASPEDRTAAAEALIAALDAAPADVEALSALAELELARARPLQAAAYLEEALLHAPGDAVLLARRDAALAEARALAQVRP